MENKSTESPVIAFTNYKRPDGFEVSLTMRSGVTNEDVLNVISSLNQAIEGIKAKGGTPVSRQKAGGGYPPKVVEYVPDRKCPTCGAQLVYAKKKDGSKFIKCSTNVYKNGQSTGCPYVDWMNKPKPKEVEVEDVYGASSYLESLE